ncbi:MAG TPA: type II secretion system F family protein [Bryobacteraceae bacterium]|nr:type II secretion system F family protein [Bryobacteraceae bacterium]
MIALVVITFLVVLAAVMLSVSSGLRYFESKRKKQLVSVLRTVSETEQEHVELLMDADAAKPNEALPGPQAMYDKIGVLISESGLDWDMNKLITLTVGGFVVGCVIGALIPFETSIFIRSGAVGAFLAYIPFMMVKKARNKRLDGLEAQLPDALDFLARSMRAGHAFTISLEMVGEEVADPLGQEFRALFNEQNMGGSLDRSLANFGKRVPLPDVRFFSSAVLLQRQTGGNLGEVLGRLSHIIRERFRLKGQIKAVSAHGKMTATILTLLPIATLVGLIIVSPQYLSPLLHDAMGRKLVIAGVTFQVLGNIFIRKIIRIRV